MDLHSPAHGGPQAHLYGSLRTTTSSILADREIGYSLKSILPPMLRSFVLYSLCFLLAFNSASAQNNDSLWTVWKDRSLPDSARLGAMHRLTELQLRTNPDSALKLAEMLRVGASKAMNYRMLAFALHFQALAHLRQGEKIQAWRAWEDMLACYQEAGDAQGIAGAEVNLATLLQMQGENQRALQYYQRSLKAFGSDASGLAPIYNNMSGLYLLIGDTVEALTYAQKALAKNEEQGDLRGKATVLRNIGLIHRQQHRYGEAMHHLRSSLAVNEEIENEAGVATVLKEIGTTFQEQEAYDSAFVYLEKALGIQKTINDQIGLAGTQVAMGTLLNRMGRTREAIDITMGGLELARRTGRGPLRHDALQNLYDIYKGTGNTALALAYLEQARALSDSVRTDAVQKELMQIEFRKELVADSLQNVQEKQTRMEQERRTKQTRYWLVGLVLLVVAGLLFRSRRKRRSPPTPQM